MNDSLKKLNPSADGQNSCAADIKTDKEMEELVQIINHIKGHLNAVILVHNYQRPEIYRVADYIGDSLELSRKAAQANADIIVFCGVKFMAETAKILNPGKTVLLPKLEAICSLADMAAPSQVKELKEKYPDAAVVSYINTNAEVKAISDICCTSANAVKVINSLPNKRIIFLPDKNLGRYVQQFTDKEIILWEGFCTVHDLLNADTLLEFKKENPGVKIIAHPECRAELLKIADYVCGTGGMAKFVSEDEGSDYIIVTECGMVHKLREDVPGKNFYSFCNFCPYMKATTLPDVYDSLIMNVFEITPPIEFMDRARESISKMLAITSI